MVHHIVWQIIGPRHGVIHIARGDQLTVAVIGGVFQQRLPDPLDHAAMHLSFNNHRVHLADLAMRQHRALGFLHGLATARTDQPARRIAAHGGKINAGKDRLHTGHRGGSAVVNRHDPRMRHVRPGKGREALAMQLNIGGVFAASGQKPHILAPLAARTDSTIPDYAVLGQCTLLPERGGLKPTLRFQM